MFSLMETEVWLLLENVAVSAAPFGTIGGIQLLAVFQSLEPGVLDQVALPAQLA